MSQNESFRLSTVGSRPQPLETRHSRATREAPYSLAGPRVPTIDIAHTRSRDPGASTIDVSRTRSRGDTFVSQEYQDYNPRHGEPANKPIWGLAAPLPRIKRPGMQPRGSSRQSKAQQRRPGPDREPTEQSVQPPAPEGTEAVPQVEVTPSRNEHEYQQLQAQTSRQSQTPSTGQDLLRRATTAHESIPGQRTALGSVDGYGRASSELEVNSARRRLQEFADTAGDVRDLQYEAPNIDWEEYQKQSVERQPSQNERATHPDYFNWWGPIRHKLRQPLAEYLGTTVFMIIGLCGSIVHMTSEDDYGNLLSAYISWGLGVMIGIYVAGGISGGHLNPTLSILLSVFRGFPWSLCWQYIVAQMLGAITASGVVYGLYRDAIEQYAAADKGRAGPAFWTAPRDGLSSAAAFFTEFVATGILVGSVFALGDDSNAPPGAGMHAFIIGLLITALCMAFSYNTGTCLNPARDFGPRLITWAAGFGTEVFTLHNWWWIWGPWVGTLSGGIMGALFYDGFIFSGGESPVNYPSGELRGRLHSWREARIKSKTGRGKDHLADVDKNIDTIA